MPASIIIGTMVFILVIGSGIAVLWWRLATKAMPYKDEEGNRTADPSRDREVVVVSSDRASRANGADGRGGHA